MTNKNTTKNTIDLRIYTKHSKGTDTAEELLTKVLQTNITAFSVTDLNSVIACATIQKLLKDNPAVQFIPGVQFRCMVGNTSPNLSCNIVGYYINPQSKILQKFTNQAAKSEYVQVEEAISIISSTGGVACLVEPEKINCNIEELLLQLIPYGLMGMECYNTDLASDEIKQYLSIAKRFNLLISGGSGYCGDDLEDFYKLGEICKSHTDNIMMSEIMGYHGENNDKHISVSVAASRVNLSKFFKASHDTAEGAGYPEYYRETLKEAIRMASSELARMEDKNIVAAWEKEYRVKIKKEDTKIEKIKLFLNHIKPNQIYTQLNKHIAGQEKAKRMISRICYEHLVRIANPGLNIVKTNYIMFGPTGCGKSEIARTLKDILPVPVDIIDASSITKNGFYGADKEDVMFLSKDLNPGIENGIIFLDEFDKICMPNIGTGGDSNKVLQGQLLKMIEGTKLQRVNKRSSDRPSDIFDTSNVTFICTGAFDGAFDAQWTSGLGFGQTKENLTDKKLITDCLIDYGMIPELAGRISTSTPIPIKNLTEDDFYDIIAVKENNYFDSLKKLFHAAYNVEIELDDDAIREMCKIAYERKLGARGLNVIIENTCRDALDDILNTGDTKLLITKDMVDASILDVEDDKYECTRNGIVQY